MGHGSFFTFDATENSDVEELQSFGQGAGADPQGGLLLAKDGLLYGETQDGGENNDGVIYRMDTYGDEQIVGVFNGANGNIPAAKLIQGSDDTFYGTTYTGGANNAGTIFAFTVAGGIKTLASLSSSTGDNPNAAPTLNSDGYLYVPCTYGGAQGYGSVVKVKTTGGTLSTIYSFDSMTNGADGLNPYGDLTVGTDGRLYGTTGYGGTNNNGVIYSMTTGGSYKLVHSLAADGSEGYLPYAGVVEASDGNFYGTTYHGGTPPYPGTDVDGVLFKVAALLPIITSYTPTSGAAGTSVVITGKNLTGAQLVSFNGVSATFTVNSDTKITTTVPNGAVDGLLIVKTGTGQATAATRFDVPSISSFTPTSAKAGAMVTITGKEFTDATTVTFNGISAKFTVTNDTTISATVPSGSATGKIAVTNNAGTGTSSATFTISS